MLCELLSVSVNCCLFVCALLSVSYVCNVCLSVCCSVRLVGSVPGAHKGADMNKWGHLKLRRVSKLYKQTTETNKWSMRII